MKLNNSLLFWDTAHRFLDVHLKNIRKLSDNTIAAYRDSLNLFISFAETELSVGRVKMNFEVFTKANLARFQQHMLIDQKQAPRTSNLRLTAIRSLLEYASQEHTDLMHLYIEACSIANTVVANQPLEYFEPEQLKALLFLPPNASKIHRRNNVILIFMYDTAARVSEVRTLCIENLHLNAKHPYVEVLGKGRKHRNIPLMERTVGHLKKYILEYHGSSPDPKRPLFYTNIKGTIDMISADTFERMIKQYAKLATERGVEMPKNVHCHMLRKTRAMDLYNAGMPLTHVQQLLGHESIDTTSGFYAFATLDNLVKSLNKVDPDNGKKVWDEKGNITDPYRL